MSQPVRTAVIAVVLLIAVLLAIWMLFTVVFPWVDRQFFANPVLG